MTLPGDSITLSGREEEAEVAAEADSADKEKTGEEGELENNEEANGSDAMDFLMI